ncbi:HEPN domain-containing protein [Micromonospora rifamycinica]|uniref:hypothetical protein n=1 Tax=Micromonospora rifamycinica TaxID=291594 RepID=UPI002E2D53FC|nr:hypothetical protein [Micromonospora rifamycinica]
MISSDDMRGLTKAYGRELLAYCLNVDMSDIERYEASPEQLPESQASALPIILMELTNLKVRAAISDTPLELFIPHLVAIDKSGTQISSFNLWRAMCGGTIPDFLTGDPVADTMAPGLTFAYPVTLAIRHLTGVPWRFGRTPDFPFDPDLSQRLGKAILEDEELSALFPNQGADFFEIVSPATTNTGCAGGLQLAVMGNALFKCAYTMFRLRQQTSAQDLRSSLTETLSILRSAARGQPTSVPAWIGIGNIHLPADSVEIPWGHMRRYPFPAEIEVIPPEARPSVTTDEEGKQITLGAILETSYMFEVVIGEPRIEASEVIWPKSMEKERARIADILTHTFFAAALASENNPPAACTHLWTAIVDPFTFGCHMSYRADVLAPVGHYQLSPSEVSELRAWAERLTSAPVNKFEIPRRRILSALAERRDPIDGFIDAVIAWESLFAGTDQGELSFRICAAMSKLLFEGAADRLAEHKKLVKLYTKRSKVLHGAQEISISDAIESRDYAIEVALECVKKLYLQYPDLLQDADRSKKIILGI